MKAVKQDTNSPGSFAEDCEVLIVGAGFAGLYLLYRLRAEGFVVKLVEAGNDLGGVWFWNCYPGARVDVEGAVYQYSDDHICSGWHYRERYPDRDAVLEYFAYVDGKWDLSRDIFFNSRVSGAVYSESARQWHVTTSAGQEVHCGMLLMCTGFGSIPYLPDIRGQRRFQGECYHTGRWPQAGVNLQGKNVGVIGTGASGVQVIQEVAASVASLTVFQRTPNLALPMRQKMLSDSDQQEIKRNQRQRFTSSAEAELGVDIEFMGPSTLAVSKELREEVYKKRWAEGGFAFLVGGFADLYTDRTANRLAYEFWRDQTRLRMRDPKVGAKLAPTTPPHPIGAKRVSLEQAYFEVFNRENVELVDLLETPIVEVTSDGIRTSGRHIPLDVIVLATGYDATTGGLKAIDFQNAKGQSFTDKWKSGIKSYLGFAVSDFPNLLMMYGPQSPSAFCNGAACAETQGDWVVQCLLYMRKHGFTRIEASAAAEEEWVEHTNEVAAKTLIVETDSWWMGANIPGKKKEILGYLGGLVRYRKRCDAVAQDGYRGFSLG